MLSDAQNGEQCYQRWQPGTLPQEQTHMNFTNRLTYKKDHRETHFGWESGLRPSCVGFACSPCAYYFLLLLLTDLGVYFVLFFFGLVGCHSTHTVLTITEKKKSDNK